MINDIYYIIQARTNSTRLPNKTIIKFYEDKTILDCIINKLRNSGIKNNRIIVATTDAQKDDILVKTIEKQKVIVHRGDENNVLNRFISAATNENANFFFRICADNPFLNLSFINEIIKTKNILTYDYISYEMNNRTPAIKTHYGLFSEYTTLETLLKVKAATTNDFDLEHVTPYIYSNRNLFNTYFHIIPKKLQDNEWLRLTIDTEQDFKVAQKIYQDLKDEDNIDKIISASLPYKNTMLETIHNNSK
jgi:spore coat polysaccharide biosynthesis protein SpsF